MPFRSQYQDRLNRDLEYVEFGEEVILKPDKRKVITDVIKEAEENEKRIKEKREKRNNGKKTSVVVPDITKRATDESKEKLITDIIEITEDASLKNKGTIRSLIYSKGGSKDKNANLNRPEADDMKFNGRKSAYLAIKINNILVLEAIGQANNATYVGEFKGEQTIQDLRDNTRTQIVDKEIMYKIMHNKGPIEGVYDYDSPHIRTILQYAVDYPAELLDVLKTHKQTGRSASTFATLQKNMQNKVKAAKSVAIQIVTKKGLTAKQVVDAGTAVFGDRKINKQAKIIKPIKRIPGGDEPSGR